MDPIWLLVPAAVGLLALRTVMVARQLKSAATKLAADGPRPPSKATSGTPPAGIPLTAADSSPQAVAPPAKARAPWSAVRSVPKTRLDEMVADCLPDRRF